MTDNMTSISSEITETVIGSKTKFKGTVETDKPLVVEGTFEGTIKSSNNVIISESGYVNATIECKEFKLCGKGEGKLICSEKLEVLSTGGFSGDIVAKDLVVVSGAKMDGTCKIG